MRITIEQAAKLMEKGQPVAVPTETVYGLAAPLKKPEAIEKIFTLKNRPASNPLIVHISNETQLYEVVKKLPEGALELMQAFWPGPLTLVLPANEKIVPNIARAGLNTIAIRMPNHPDCLSLIDKVGPCVAPSANISGRPSSTLAAHVEADFGKNFPVIDSGPCGHGLESTILIPSWSVGRLGSLSIEKIEKVLGQPLHVKSAQCPGQKWRHYSPKARLTFTDSDWAGQIVLGLSGVDYPNAKKVIKLGSTDGEVAINLYTTLRQLDTDGVTHAMIDSRLPKGGLWDTIQERLTKASDI